MVYLCVKGVGRQLVGAIEGVGISLTHDQTIISSTEELSLVKSI